MQRTRGGGVFPDNGKTTHYHQQVQHQNHQRHQSTTPLQPHPRCRQCQANHHQDQILHRHGHQRAFPPPMTTTKTTPTTTPTTTTCTPTIAPHTFTTTLTTTATTSTSPSVQTYASKTSYLGRREKSGNTKAASPRACLGTALAAAGTAIKSSTQRLASTDDANAVDEPNSHHSPTMTATNHQAMDARDLR